MEEFKSTYPLIHNKVTSPRYVTPLLRRPRLLDWLSSHAEARAVVIAAGAGYGKTTLLWQWEREVDFPCYWYKLDRNDRDWTLHISYLVEAISQHYPGFGRRAHSVLRQMGGPGSSRPGVAAFLLAEMHEKLTSPCTFIIDDWQFVASVTEVRGLWNQILRDAPPTCRFIFASRGKPQLQFARFKTHGGYAELRTDDLRITGPEITELFRDVYRDPLTPDEASELERRTEGWAASLQLVEVSMRERRTPEERRALIDSLVARSDSDLFTFLAEEVLDQQTEETRNFLLSTSILQQITAEVAERLAGVHEGMRRLLQLEHGGLFTERLDETRYRYHGLFREFLERRLTDERSEAEVLGLHIHAASYFETSAQWPEAIYHYLRAGLQRQAARLIARYGEDVVSEGRLGMVDEWLQQLPAKTIHDNARLSLLHGEALGIRGELQPAIEALGRARDFFERKGDRRMEALAVLKESSIHVLWGHSEESARLAGFGLEIAPPDDRTLRLRLEGNWTMTSAILHDPLPQVVEELQRLSAEASALGLDHYAAVGLHNLGIVHREAGALRESAAVLEKSTRFWSQESSSPYADNHELVHSLLCLGDLRRAQDFARRGLVGTSAWPRAFQEARCGEALVLMAKGDFGSAIDRMKVLVFGADSGATTETAAVNLIEGLVLSEADKGQIGAAARILRSRQRDQRLRPATETALALANHQPSQCDGACVAGVDPILDDWRSRGAVLLAATCDLKLAPARLEHGDPDAPQRAIEAIRTAEDIGALWYMRFWTRRLGAAVWALAKTEGGPRAVAALVRSDPDFWRNRVPPLLADLSPEARAPLLQTVRDHGNLHTASLLATSIGADVSEIKARLIRARAPRLYVRTFGVLSIQVGGWRGKPIRISKRRLRALLALLVAHIDEDLARDVVLDTLWPDSDPASSVNSLNQTVFQLRREMDPTYRSGDRPTYVISTTDAVRLDRDLVRTDLDEIRRRFNEISSVPRSQRGRFASEILDFIRGEFLSEVRYEDWSASIRNRVHSELRHHLAELADGMLLEGDHEVGYRAGCAMSLLDEWDESAYLAMAHSLASMGRWQTAAQVLDAFRNHMRSELDETPSTSFEEAAGLLMVKRHLTRESSVAHGS